MEEQINRLGQHAAETALEMVADTTAKSQQHGITKQNYNVKQIITNQNNKNMESIINQVTLDEVRKCLDKLELNSKQFLEEGYLVTSLSDSELPVDLLFVFKIEDFWLKMQSFAQGYSISANESEDKIIGAYMNVNAYNNYCRYGRAYFDQNFEENSYLYIFEENLIREKAVSFEYLYENVRSFMASAYHFYNTYVFNKNESDGK